MMNNYSIHKNFLSDKQPFLTKEELNNYFSFTNFNGLENQSFGAHHGLLDADKLVTSNLGLALKELCVLLSALDVPDNEVHEVLTILHLSWQDNVRSDLKQVIENQKPTFVELLHRHLDCQQIPLSSWYKMVEVDRRYFYKIKSGQLSASKRFIIRTAISLHLNIDETNELLASAGYVLSYSIKQDLVLIYFISKRMYNLTLINEALYTFDLPTI